MKHPCLTETMLNAAIARRPSVLWNDEPPTTRSRSAEMVQPIPHNQPQYRDDDDLSIDAKVQLEDAVREASERAQLLIFECGSDAQRFALGEHLSAQAYRARGGEGPSSVDAYLDLSSHPDRPARCVVQGVVGYWADLAGGLHEALAGTRALAIDRPERMLTIMPVRLTRFVQSCVQQGVLVVLLVPAIDAALRITWGPLQLRTDVVPAPALPAERVRDVALAAIASAAGRGLPSDAAGDEA